MPRFPSSSLNKHVFNKEVDIIEAKSMLNIEFMIKCEYMTSSKHLFLDDFNRRLRMITMLRKVLFIIAIIDINGRIYAIRMSSSHLIER